MTSPHRAPAPPPATAATGLLLVNKPAGMTSHDVVQVVRRRLSMRRIGHTGILDPMARGLLVLLIGAATRHQREFQGHDKTYEATVRFGTRTDTGDATGRVLATAPIPPMDAAAAARILASLRGPLTQTPPAYSAVKVRGRPAYWWTRRNQPVTLAPRLVRIHEIHLNQVNAETLSFRLHCSAGTYIRTLAETIAERLDCVGHLASLVRLRIGQWTLEDAHTVTELREASTATLAEYILPPPTSHAGV